MKVKTKFVLNVTVSKNGFPPTKAVLLYYLIREANIYPSCWMLELDTTQKKWKPYFLAVVPSDSDAKYSLIIFQDATIFVIFT